MSPMSPPVAPGLYDPAHEHDACGIGLVARLHNGPTHEVVERAILAVEHLYHRGATGADADTGDGAGILLDIPDVLLREAVDFALPPAGQYAVAMCFLPTDDARRAELEALLDETVEAEGQRVLGWRDVPVAPEHCGRTARLAMPVFRQLFVGASPELAGDRDAFERKVYVIRRVAEMAAGPDLVMPSFSARTIVYKGMLTSLQLPEFYPDLRDERVVSRSALVHARFSTNTFPSWELAHPYRMIAHNGEINTLMGNVNWMRARESQRRSELFGDDLRPGRWVETASGYVVLASEAGVLPIQEEGIVRKGRLQPGRLFLVDLDEGRVVEDAEIKQRMATRRPYREWFERCSVHFDDLPEAAPRSPRVEPRRHRQLAFGYSQEDLRVLLTPMANTGQEPIGSMGNDLALAVMSDRQPSLFAYFKQLFAQVTNPAIDPIRESIVMSLASGVGPSGNLLDETPEHAHQLVMRQPILRDHELERLRQVSHDVFRSHTIDITWPVAQGPEGLGRAVERICLEAHDMVAEGINVLILSDREVGAERVAIPSLLAVGAVHHHLVREGTRLRCGLVIESGEPRETHHMATLIGYGAAAINPYLMLESLTDLRQAGVPGELSQAEAEDNVVKAIGKGLLKVLSKMGIS